MAAMSSIVPSALGVRALIKGRNPDPYLAAAISLHAPKVVRDIWRGREQSRS